MLSSFCVSLEKHALPIHQVNSEHELITRATVCLFLDYLRQILSVAYVLS